MTGRDSTRFAARYDALSASRGRTTLRDGRDYFEYVSRRYLGSHGSDVQLLRGVVAHVVGVAADLDRPARCKRLRVERLKRARVSNAT
jgi:hypothetical protein